MIMVSLLLLLAWKPRRGGGGGGRGAGQAAGGGLGAETLIGLLPGRAGGSAAPRVGPRGCPKFNVIPNLWR